jgi:hypothetical protein
MPKISLWKPEQGNDYNYIDRVAREYIELGGTGVYVHKYIGPTEQTGDDNKSNVGDGVTTDELTIGDVLFLENRDRKYDPDIIEMRGAYTLSDTDFDLTQFGIFLSDDTIFMTFHLNENVERLGRKLMAGDVLELPHLREYHGLDADKPATNRFYVVEDASHSAEGKQMPASTEYQDILDRLAGDGQSLESLPPPENPDDCCEETLEDSLSNKEKLDEITDAIIEEAAKDVRCDPLWFDAAHLYVCIDSETREHQLIWFKTGDGNPPNGQALAGSGATFPETLVDGDYYLRTDFDSPILYQKQGSTFKKPWTGANQLLDSFIDNEETSILDDGTEITQRQALSKVIRAKPIDGEAQEVPTNTNAPALNGDDENLFGPSFGEEFD